MADSPPPAGPSAVALGVVQMSHHAGPSGYGEALAARILERVPSAYVATEDASVLGRLPGSLSSRLSRRTGRPWYTPRDLSIEGSILVQRLRRRGLLVHILSGENMYLFSGRGRALAGRRGNRLVATFHQPPGVFWRAGPSRASLQRLDKVIALCRSQAGFFESIVGAERVATVPHGVDTDYFKPSAAAVRHRTPTCLMVGQWLRDWAVLAEVAAGLADRGVRVRLASPVASVPEAVRAMPTVTVLPRLSDAALREEYRRSDLQLMPLTDSTANNALLEGLACGLPAIASDVGGVADYVDDSSGELVPPGDSHAMLRAALRVVEDEPLREVLSLGARRQSLRFGWPQVVTTLLREYDSLY